MRCWLCCRGIYSVCMGWLCSWIAVSGVMWMSCFDVLQMTVNICILYCCASSVHDNANGIDWLAALWRVCSCELCCKKNCAGCLDTWQLYLIVGFDLWHWSACIRMPPAKLCNNVIAMVCRLRLYRLQPRPLPQLRHQRKSVSVITFVMAMATVPAMANVRALAVVYVRCCCDCCVFS